MLIFISFVIADVKVACFQVALLDVHAELEVDRDLFVVL